MERLEPILKQKFWILLFFGIVMTFTGWWMATGAMANAISERKTKIEAAENSIPKEEIPNETWSKRLAVINGIQDTSNRVTNTGLWKRQLAKMTIPEGLDQTVGYQGKFTSDDREIFRVIYPNEVRKVWKMLNPMDVDGSGVVNFPLTSMAKLMNQKPWIISAPKSEVIWDILEDLWLLEGLFQSIAEANGGVEAGRMEACVHQIDKLELRGGGDKLPTGGGSSGGGSEGMFGGGFSGGPMGSGGGPMGGPGGGGAGAAGASMTSVSAEFDVREEFGDDGSGASTTGGGGGGGGPMRSGLGGLGAMMGGDSSGGGGSAVAETVVKRYVSDVPGTPYKTRGFYLSVKMDHRRIPQLIAELTANDKTVWPVTILRVQMTRLHEDDSIGGGSGGGYGSSRMTQGYPGAMASGEGGGGAMGPLGKGAGLKGAFGGSNPAASGNDDFAAFTSLGSSGGSGGNAVKSAQLIAAQTLLENTLRDPYMAQVTLCGVFTMYRKVEESAEPKPATTAPQGFEEAAATEGNGAVTGDDTATQTSPADSTGANSTETELQAPAAAAAASDGLSEPGTDPLDNAGEMPDSPAAKPEDEKSPDEPKTDTDLK